MKRWHYLCAAALIAGSMAAGAGAVSIPCTALTQLQQQRQQMLPQIIFPQTAAFSDCENGSVCLAAALGIVTGYVDGTFRPYQSITRQQAALIPYHAPTASRCAPF